MGAEGILWSPSHWVCVCVYVCAFAINTIIIQNHFSLSNAFRYLDEIKIANPYQIVACLMGDHPDQWYFMHIQHIKRRQNAQRHLYPPNHYNVFVFFLNKNVSPVRITARFQLFERTFYK